MWPGKAISQQQKKSRRPLVLSLHFRNINDVIVHGDWSKRCSKKAIVLADIWQVKCWQPTDLRLFSGSGRPSRSFVPRTTNSRHTLGFNSNLLLNQVLPIERNKVWVSDITYIMLANGQWAYLATWMDLWSRLIAGWHLDNNMEEDPVVTAFRRAALGRQPAGGAHRSFRSGWSICL